MGVIEQIITGSDRLEVAGTGKTGFSDAVMTSDGSECME
jgi:hypothetical protein